MADAKEVKEPETVLQAVPSANAGEAFDAAKVALGIAAEEEQVKAAAPNIDPSNICTWIKAGEVPAEIVFEDGSKFIFPSREFSTSDLVLSGKINTVREKYRIGAKE